MLELPAFRTLSLSARRVLDRLEIEFAHHGGTDNGLLPVTFDNFVDYGMDRHSVAPAIRELEALGFAKITTRGRAGNAEFRTPNKFRITYKHTNDANPTNEWKSIHTIELADELAKAARAPRPARSHAARNRKPVRENSQPCAENSHLAPVQEIPTTADGQKPPLLSISRGGELGQGLKPARVRPRIESHATSIRRPRERLRIIE